MKKLIIITLSMMVIYALGTAGVRETKHNFSSSTYSPNAYFLGTQRVCVFCHTVHNSELNGPAPLWNHENSTQTYLMYNNAYSNTIDMNQSAQPNDGSLVCLSCHDGTIAINSLNNVPGPEGAGTYGTPGGSALDGAGKLTAVSNAFVGVDLRDDHPVGIIYDQTKDNDFKPKTGNSTLYPDKLLDDGISVECISCHNPHDNTWGNFLVESNANSNLCTQCHVK